MTWNSNPIRSSRPAIACVSGSDRGAGPRYVSLDWIEDGEEPEHTEFRDDRFVAATDLRDGPLHLFYVLRVVTPGKFTVPAPFAEDMYRPDVRGVGKAEADISVVDPRVK